MEFSSLAGPTTGRSLVLFEEGAAKPGMNGGTGTASVAPVSYTHLTLPTKA